MNSTQNTIQQFFTGKNYYQIPVYQRAYSWEEYQWKQFLADLQEVKANHYFFGNVLLQKNGDMRDIIDGQQRITTIIIFARAVYDTLKQCGESEDVLQDIAEDYFYYRKSKLNAVEYDRDYFKKLIIEGDDGMHDPQTPSQIRIYNAKAFFKEQLKNLDKESITQLFNIVKESQILEVNFDNIKDSVLMFELQNNRGKNLTNMEKLKSYFSYQIYNNCDNAEDKLSETTRIFEEIYRLINDIKTLNEDEILLYFNYYKFGYAYRENNDTLNYKKHLKESQNIIKFIDDYTKDLKNAFVNLKIFFALDNKAKNDLLRLNAWEIYPFIIKAYTLFGTDETKLNEVFKLLEIIIFRDKLSNTRADLASRLISVLKNFTDLESLKNALKSVCESEYYWSDDNIQNTLRYIYNSKGNTIVPYILEKYENSLRQNNNVQKDYIFTCGDNLKDVSREHIAPQTNDGEEIATGYDKYDSEFYEKYLHNIGNLVLVTPSHNSSNSNKPFSEKLPTFTNNTDLLQQREIKDFLVNGEIWDKAAIDKRFEKIKNFVLENWKI
ncbi:DUF262 domain-containing protein [Lonepinella sp. BR2474]|uniref:DUF262 domain-containing protein n=1 Tax=Lonepinella sp. BR2474 TaxID=3434548 RepID=UPI003F6E041A